MPAVTATRPARRRRARRLRVRERAAFTLRRVHYQPSAGDAAQCAPHRELVALKVHIAPCERDRFAFADPDGDRGYPECFEPVAFGCGDEPPYPVNVERV